MDRIEMRGVVRLCLSLAALAGIPPVASDAARFELISAERSVKLERDLQSAAREGYRLVVAARGFSVNGRSRVVALLEHRSGDPSEYAVIEGSGNLTDEETRRELEEFAASGYRLKPGGVVVRQLADFWLPDETYDRQVLLILERNGTTGPRSYDSVAFGDFEPFYRDLRERRSAGYEVLGMWNGGRRLQLILERPGGDEPPALSEGELDYRILIMATRTGLRMKLRKAASVGYRVQAAEDPSIIGPPMLLLARTAGPDDPIEYRLLDNVPKKLRKDKLARKLNRKARKGWRVAADGSTKNAFTLERVTKRDPQAVYRSLSSKNAPGITAALEDAIEQGYRFLFMYVEPAETTVLLEKPPSGGERTPTIP